MLIYNYKLYKVRGSLIYLNIKESPMMKKRSQGVYEPEKHAAFKYFLNPGDVVIDAGSNKGDFSLWASKLVGPNGKVFSYEPEPENCKWIKKSIKINGYENITVRQVALSDENDEIDLFVGFKSGWHSIIDKPGRKYMTGEKIKIDSVTLDSEVKKYNIDKIRLIKMDVQGAETKILEGSRNVLLSNDDLILLIDLHPNEIDVSKVGTILSEYGYKFFKIKSPYNREVKDITKSYSILARK